MPQGGWCRPEIDARVMGLGRPRVMGRRVSAAVGVPRRVPPGRRGGHGRGLRRVRFGQAWGSESLAGKMKLNQNYSDIGFVISVLFLGWSISVLQRHQRFDKRSEARKPICPFDWTERCDNGLRHKNDKC